MRDKMVYNDVRIVAAPLNSETLEIIAQYVGGAIYGAGLPRHERTVRFVQNGKEMVIEPGEYLIAFVFPKDQIFQIWNKKMCALF